MMKYGKTFGVQIEWQWIVFKYNENDLDHGQLLADMHDIQFNYYHSTRWSTVELQSITTNESSSYASFSENSRCHESSKKI